jgi:hypothetical protein
MVPLASTPFESWRNSCASLRKALRSSFSSAGSFGRWSRLAMKELNRPRSRRPSPREVAVVRLQAGADAAGDRLGDLLAALGVHLSCQPFRQRAQLRGLEQDVVGLGLEDGGVLADLVGGAELGLAGLSRRSRSAKLWMVPT